MTIKKKTVLVGIRITEEERAKLDAVCNFLGITRTECLLSLLEKEYAENKDAIETMLASRAEVKNKS